MRGKYTGTYISKNGNRVFKYDVTGSPEDIQAFEGTQQKVVINEETGNPIFFSTRFAGDDVELGVSEKQNVYINTEELDKAASLVSQFDGAMADKLADRLLDGLLGKAPAASVETPATEQSNSDMGDL